MPLPFAEIALKDSDFLVFKLFGLGVKTEDFAALEVDFFSLKLAMFRLRFSHHVHSDLLLLHSLLFLDTWN